MIEFGGSATIPTGQYQNIEPAFTVEAESFEEARDLWLTRMAEIHSLVGKQLDIQPATSPLPVEWLTCWASGAQVPFEPVNHRYGKPGESWMSGSVFASQFMSEFDAGAASWRVGNKHGVDSRLVRDMWELNASASTLFGSAVHAAVQLRGQYIGVSQATKDGTDEACLTKNTTLRPIVEEFFNNFPGPFEHEVFVADVDSKRCGQIDLLKVVAAGAKTCRVGDLKTNADIRKKQTIKAPFKGVVSSDELGGYWLQLSFYADLLVRHGWTVEGLDIFHWDADYGWQCFSRDVVDLSGVLK